MTGWAGGRLSALDERADWHFLKREWPGLIRSAASTSTSVPLTKGSRTLSGVHVIHACVEVLGGE